MARNWESNKISPMENVRKWMNLDQSVSLLSSNDIRTDISGEREESEKETKTEGNAARLILFFSVRFKKKRE